MTRKRRAEFFSVIPGEPQAREGDPEQCFNFLRTSQDWIPFLRFAPAGNDRVYWIPFPVLWTAGNDKGGKWCLSRYAVYMLASKRNGTLYIGVTGNLPQRIEQHQAKAVKGFTKQYDVIHLVWFERHSDINEAIAREKQLKGWNRAWKLKLLEASNPDWSNLDPTT